MCLSISGCNALKFTYERAPTLAFWWIDGYLELSDRQTPQVRYALRAWFDRHRRDALPAYRALLHTLQRELAADTTPAAVCALHATWQRQIARDYATAVAPLADLVLTLTPAQIDHLARQFAKRQTDLAEEYLEGTPARRDDHVARELRETLETLYGRLSRAQRRSLAAGVAAAPFDSARWLAERRARQADIVAGLRALPAAGVRGHDDRRARATHWLQGLGRDFVESPRLDYRAHHAQVQDANCALIADLHNRMTAKQRARAMRKVSAWREALDALIATPTQAGRDGRNGGFPFAPRREYIPAFSRSR